MKTEQKNKGQEKRATKPLRNLEGKKIDAEHARQVKGGLRRLRDDESPKE